MSVNYKISLAQTLILNSQHEFRIKLLGWRRFLFLFFCFFSVLGFSASSSRCVSVFYIRWSPPTDCLSSLGFRSCELWRVRVWLCAVRPEATLTPLYTGSPLTDALCPTPPGPRSTRTAHWTSSSALSRTLVCLHPPTPSSSPGGCACVVYWAKLLVCFCTQKTVGLKYLPTSVDKV